MAETSEFTDPEISLVGALAASSQEFGESAFPSITLMILRLLAPIRLPIFLLWDGRRLRIAPEKQNPRLGQGILLDRAHVPVLPGGEV